MSPSRRERAYARRRYEKWVAKQQARAAARRRNRRILLIGAATLAVIALVSGTFWFLGRDDDDGTAAAAETGDTACPKPSVKPPAKPKTFPKVPAKTDAAGKAWTMKIATTCGDVTLTLDGKRAPQATSVMLTLARAGYFDGSSCHRLTTQGIFVLQCGDPTGTGTGGPGFTFGPIENAPKNNVYPAGTVAMARQSGKGDSMGSQFFLVYKESTIPADAAGGYTMFGTISGGIDVVTKVAAGGVDGGAGDGAPKRAVSIARTTVTPG